jgi:hypothetical protein
MISQQSTCANYFLTCYEGGQGTFEDCVNSTQAQVYYCVRQLCSCEDVGTVEAWVYVYGTSEYCSIIQSAKVTDGFDIDELITTLWSSITPCVSTSKITLIGSPLSTWNAQSNSSSASPAASTPAPEQTTTTTPSQAQSPLIQTTSAPIPSSMTPTSETISSTSTSTYTTSTRSPASSTVPPSGSSSGISTNAKIGIGVGAGLGGAGFLTLAAAFCIWHYRRKAGASKGGPQTAQQQPNPTQNGFDRAELPVNEVVSPAFSELEGSPVHRHFMQSDSNATTTSRDHRERSELQSTSTVSELDSSTKPRGDG